MVAKPCLDAGDPRASVLMHRNGTLDRGLETEHGCVRYLLDDTALAVLALLYLIQISFFHKNQRYRNSSLLFPYFSK